MTTGLQTTKPQAVAGVLLMPQIAGLIRENTSLSDGSVTDYSFHNDWDLDSFNVEELRGSYDRICDDIKHNSIPLEKKEIAALIARMYAMTARKREDQISLDLAVTVYGEELFSHPGEIVRKVLTDWPRKSDWWPTWKMLETEIQRLDDRQKLKSAFRTMLNKLGVPFSELD